MRPVPYYSACNDSGYLPEIGSSKYDFKKSVVAISIFWIQNDRRDAKPALAPEYVKASKTLAWIIQKTLRSVLIYLWDL